MTAVGSETSASRGDARKIIVFLGPSLGIQAARRILPNAEFRPPIKRGDLDGIECGALVGIVDGVFAQTLSISPTEIRDAIARGVVVFGASSMGALRAAEIPQMHAIGRIAGMYRDGAIDRDDEVALLFAPETFLPVTVPHVNLRHGVERLARSGTLSREAGAALIEASARLHFSQRTYDQIIAASPLANASDREDLVRLLRGFDLKRDDAQLLLETLAESDMSVPGVGSTSGSLRPVDGVYTARAQPAEHHDAPILIWESGDRLAFDDILMLLMITGLFERVAHRAIGRLAATGAPVRPATWDPVDQTRITDGAQMLLDATRLIWGWESPEEAHVTMRDLGLGLSDVAPTLRADVEIGDLIAELNRRRSPRFRKALRAELFLDDLALKRAALRCGALKFFAARAAAEGAPPTDEELDAARRAISRLRSAMQWPVVQADLSRLGVESDALEATVSDVALARRLASPIVAALDRRSLRQTATPRAETWRTLGLGLLSSPKAAGSARFSMDLAAAEAPAEEIARQIGIVRIGMIGELDTLGVHIAQAFGARSGWSTSFSSGKSQTRAGARVGSIMEEVEIFAQDAFQPLEPLRRAFAEVAVDSRFADPVELGLPFDSRYDDSLDIDWVPAVDLLTGSEAMVPAATVMGERLAHDILYSSRLGGKIFSSSGLGSGFTLAEAAVHALAELIERHAVRLAEIEIDNPGGVGLRRFEFVDLESLPATPAAIAGHYLAAGMTVRILDITSEIEVPTFYARVFDDPFRSNASMSSDGFACHPSPQVAITMALLEAAQTKAGVIAGGREDYSLQARSLGRHERPRTMVPSSQVFWFCGDRPIRAFDSTQGFDSPDILTELEWMVDRVADAGFRQCLLVDLTTDRIRPAHAVRMLVPGTETTNPLYTGLRARATLIRDFLTRPVRAASGRPR